MFKKIATFIHEKMDRFHVWPWLCLGSYLLGLLGPASIIIGALSVYVIWIMTPYIFSSKDTKKK